MIVMDMQQHNMLRDAETLLSSPLGSHLTPTTEPLMLNYGSSTPPVLPGGDVQSAHRPIRDRSSAEAIAERISEWVEGVGCGQGRVGGEYDGWSKRGEYDGWEWRWEGGWEGGGEDKGFVYTHHENLGFRN